MPADEPEGPVSADAGAGEQQDTKQSEPQPSATTAAAPAPADAKATATQQTDAESQASARKRQTKDFEFGGILGEGSYSTVIYAKEPSTGREFAVKMLDKRQIVRERKIKYVNVEKDVLNLIHQHPFIVRLFYTFQDTHSLYFVLELAKNGDLLGYLKRLGRFGHQGAQFYTGEIVEAVKFLHSKGVIHRDLKPEILLDEKYHIKITDFGTAKILDSDQQQQQQQQQTSDKTAADDGTTADKTVTRRASFVGTAEYCSPELLNDREASTASDVWAIGCILYQLLVGRPPFKGSNEYQTFQRIIHLKYAFPAHDDTVDGGTVGGWKLVETILNLDPAQRPTLDAVKEHAFFAGLVWDGLERQTPPSMSCLEPMHVPGEPDQPLDDYVDDYADDHSDGEDELVGRVHAMGLSSSASRE